MALTKRQKEFLDFFSSFVEENGYCPSYEEIARGLQLSSLATVHKHVCSLEAKNYLRRGFNQSRSLELAPRYLQEHRRARPQSLEVPLLGRIAAGTPVESVEQREVSELRRFRRQREHLRPRSPRQLDDRGPHLRRRYYPAGASGAGA